MDINQKTERLLKSFINRPTSSVIIHGDEYDGVDQIIEDFSSQLLGLSYKNNRIEIKPEDGKPITIEQARFLKKTMQNKLHTENEIARVGIVWRADTATREAQNALLKLIEEPVEHTVLILQCDDTQRLLPTVRSRCQIVSILPLEKSVAVTIATKQGVSDTEARKAYTLSKGKARLFQRLLNDPGTTPDSIINAKKFLQDSVSVRLQQSKSYDSPEKIIDLIEGIDLITHAALQTPRKDANKFYHILSEIRECKKLLSQNALVKLVYLRLCVNL
jgi:hypothetical protein